MQPLARHFEIQLLYADLGDILSGEKIFFSYRNFFTSYLEDISHNPTFALPIKNWVFFNVSANQNQITVLRS